MNSAELLKMTVLDIVSRYNSTVDVFNNYNSKAGECICCNALFETVQDIIKKYNIDTAEFLERIGRAIEDELKSKKSQDRI